jgi:hypothetical protein
MNFLKLSWLSRVYAPLAVTVEHDLRLLVFLLGLSTMVAWAAVFYTSFSHFNRVTLPAPLFKKLGSDAYFPVNKCR